MKPDWDEFGRWVVEYLEVPNIPLKCTRIKEKWYDIVRIDVFPDSDEYRVVATIEDHEFNCTRERAYELSKPLSNSIMKAIELKQPQLLIKLFPDDLRR
jgi:hypothetical protein